MNGITLNHAVTSEQVWYIAREIDYRDEVPTAENIVKRWPYLVYPNEEQVYYYGIAPWLDNEAAYARVLYKRALRLRMNTTG